MKICGNIFATDDYSYFSLRCVMCTESFGFWTAFIQHLGLRHVKGIACEPDTGLKLENESDSDHNNDGNPIERPKSDSDGEECKIFKQSKDEIEIDGNDDVFRDMDNSSSDDGDAGNSSDSESETSSLESQTALPKRFQYDLHDKKKRRISLEFLKLLEKHRLLWDKRHPNHKKPILKTKSFIEIKLHLKKIGYLITDTKIRTTMKDIIDEHDNAKLDADSERSKYVLEKCKFLIGCEELDDEKKIKPSDDNDKQTKRNTDKRTTRSTNNTKKEPKPTVTDDNEQTLTDTDIKLNDFKSELADDFSNDDLKYDPDYDNIEPDGESQHSNADNPEIEMTTGFAFKPRRAFKRIRFYLFKSKIAGDFISLVHENPILWDTTRTDYNNMADRKQIIEGWIQLFKERHNVDFTYDDISLNIQNLRLYYHKLATRKSYMDDETEQMRTKLSFLPKRPGSRRINCDHCEAYFLSQKNHQAHLYAAHKIGESPFQCSECPKNYASSYQLTAHIKQVHSKTLDFFCTVCNLKFLSASNLARHSSVHTGEKQFICEICGQGFRCKFNMKNHETRIHLRQRNFPCSMCPKLFYTKGLLKDHLNAHLNIRNFKCPFCEKSFHSSHARRRHKQIHAEIKRYACQMCDARFHQRIGLNSHMKSRHKYVRARNETASGDEDVMPELRMRAQDEYALEMLNKFIAN